MIRRDSWAAAIVAGIAAFLVAWLLLSIAAHAQSTAHMQAGSASVVTTGGTAVTAIVGPVRGCFLYNPPDAVEQGITAAEKLYVDPVATATTSSSATNSAIEPGQGWNCPGMLPPGQNISVNAATSGHKFEAVQW